MVVLVEKTYSHNITTVSYYEYSQLKKGISNPSAQYTYYYEDLKVGKVDDHSKIAVWHPEGNTLIFLTFLDVKGEVKSYKSIKFKCFGSPNPPKYKMDLKLWEF